MADDSGLGPETEEDVGQPIDELRGYEEATPTGFVGRVVAALRRRTLASHLATLSWSAIGQVLLEFLKMIYSLFESRKSDRGESD